MPINAIIVGMPRSGTSMCAGVFARLGYSAALPGASEELRDGDKFNRDGYWEAKSLIDRNVEVFEAAGYGHHNTWMFDPITDETADNIQHLQTILGHQEFIETFNDHSPWVWKDPRLCYTLPYWWSALPKNCAKVLLIRRNPEDIYNSFLRVGWRVPDADSKVEVFGRIQKHLEHAERAIDDLNIPCLKLHYSSFQNEPRVVAQQLSEFFEVGISVEDLNFRATYNNGTAFRKLLVRLASLKRFVPRSIVRWLKKLRS